MLRWPPRPIQLACAVDRPHGIYKDEILRNLADMLDFACTGRAFVPACKSGGIERRYLPPPARDDAVRCNEISIVRKETGERLCIGGSLVLHEFGEDARAG